MTLLTETDNALDSLTRMARECTANDWSTPGMKALLWWGWHAVMLLAHHRLSPEKDRFDQWFWTYLEGSEAPLDVERDTRWRERERLSLFQLLDILSAEDLEILDTQFYQGWQDRQTRCRTLRQRVAGVLEASIDEDTRERLLLLLAAYHRLLRVPGGVDIDPAPVRAALPKLLELIELLIDPDHDHATAILEQVQVCRQSL